MILLDTHAWIWWAGGSPRLTRRASRAIESADALGVSAISCWEVAGLVAQGRLALDRDPEVWLDLALKLPRVRLLPLSPRIAARSARLGAQAPEDPVDRVIVATGLDYGCRIVSKDKRIRRFPSVRVTW